MRWLQLRTVLTIHRLQIAEHGGEQGVRDLGLLESAMARPINRAHFEPNSDIAALAAAYAFGIARNHPFLDGNKRTALVAAETFLRINGVPVAASPESKYLAFINLADGSFSEEQLATEIREWIAAGRK